MPEIVIDRRYRGPEDSGNGGYTCGLVAGHLEGDVEVTLRHPPPLDRPLAVRDTADGVVEVWNGETLIAEAHSVELSMEVPDPPDLAAAEAASRRYAGSDDHAFPTCFACGTDRNDGLLIHPGRVSGRNLWAAPWHPDRSLPNTDGVLDEAVVWAALDCPGAWAMERAIQDAPVVLGRMAARVEHPMSLGRAYVAVGWPLGTDGRKLYSGTALFDQDGNRCGLARQTWIVLS